MTRKYRFSFPENLDHQVLLDGLQSQHRVVLEDPSRTRVSYYDTFDWRLFRKGLVLFRRGDSYGLRELEHEECIATAVCDPADRPKFWWDFPPGRLREKLARPLAVRSLLHLVTVENRAQALQLINGEQKPSLRIILEELQVGGRPNPGSPRRTIALDPKIGRGPELRQMRRRLRDLGAEVEASDGFLTALRVAGIRPASYSSRLEVFLQPFVPARQAFRIILERLLQSMKQNEQGIIVDVDTEFLHDFRVAVRRTRSALALIEGVFPAEELGFFRKEFATLGKASNRLRDLDVYRLKEIKYRSLLPEPLRPGLDPLFEAIAAERETELRKFQAVLQADRYRELKDRWHGFLTLAAQNRMAPSPDSDRPVETVARQFIARSYRKVLKLGGHIGQSGSDRDLHRLRIRGKRLRYLLEFFSSLYPPAEIGRFVKQLKKLQDNLGDYNDLKVQQADLAAFLKGVQPGTAEAVLRAAALGGLIGRLNLRQKEVREAFDRTFAGFGRRRNEALFRRLFGSP